MLCYHVIFCQALPRMLFCCQALRLHVLQLVYNRLFRVSRQLQNVRLYNYHDGVKMHSRRVCFRLVAFTRFAWCKVFADCVSFAACFRLPAAERPEILCHQSVSGSAGLKVSDSRSVVGFWSGNVSEGHHGRSAGKFLGSVGSLIMYPHTRVYEENFPLSDNTYTREGSSQKFPRNCTLSDNTRTRMTQHYDQIEMS